MTTLLALGIAMAVALVFNRIVKKLHLPNVTGYLVGGLLIGPSILNLFPASALEGAQVIVTVALGFIAFSIGGEFKFSNIKKIGGSVLVITFCQALMAAAVVTAALLIFGFSMPLSLTLGAIATATAPAATLMVVRQYKARGPIVNILLPVVALDDAIGLIVFSVCLSVAQALSGSVDLSAAAMILQPLREIGLSLAIGIGLGLVLSLALRFFASRANRICLVVCAVFLGVALAEMLGLSSLLLCMCIGAVMANMFKDYEKVLEVNERWTPPLFLLFFVISGADIDLSVLSTVGLLGVVYILARSLGKYFGAFLGASIVRQEKPIRNYLGITLLPQAGVAIGMSQIAVAALPEYGPQIRAVVLSATVIYELVGPLLTKLVLTRAGEIIPEPKRGKRETKA